MRGMMHPRMKTSQKKFANPAERKTEMRIRKAEIKFAGRSFLWVISRLAACLIVTLPQFARIRQNSPTTP
jgi:hypothetical protein